MASGDSQGDSSGSGDARPSALQIIKDNELQGKLVGKFAVITGASSGIGVETARALAATGIKLFLPVRNREKAEAALRGFFDPERMELIDMDHSSLESVRAGAEGILAKTDKINILVENAGIMAVPDLQHSKDGYELQFATNHLSHFLLFQLLKPALLAASTTELQSRVVVVSSAGHRGSGLNDPGNYNFERGGYDGWAAYSQSKTANIYMASELERRYLSRGLHATSVHPGLIATDLGRNLPEDQLQSILQNEAMKNSWKSVEQGAATTIWAAVSKEWEGRGGKYLADCSETVLGDGDPSGPEPTYVKHTYNAEGEARLWKDSLAMVGLKDGD